MHNNHPIGFSLVEVLLAVSVFGLLVLGLISAIMYGQEGGVLAGKRARAMQVGEEVFEVTRNIRDAAFSNLTVGQHGLAVVGNQWVFSGTSDTLDSFQRSLTLSAVDRRKIDALVQVEWTQTAQRPGQLQAETWFTNWQRSFADWTTADIQSSVDLPGNSNGYKLAVYETATNIYSIIVRNSSPTAELFVVEITDPALPTVISSFELGADANDVEMSGSLALVASSDDTQELMVVDLSTISAPTLLSSVNLPGNANGQSLALIGNSVFLGRSASADPEFYSISISTPAAPFIISSLDLGGDIYSLVASPNQTYVYGAISDNSQELVVISAADPASLSLAGAYDATGNSNGMAVAAFDTAAVLGRDDGTVEVISVATPAAPSLIGGPVDIGNQVNDLVMGVGDIYVFAAGTTTPISILDISTPSTPTVLKTVALTGDILGVQWIFDLNWACVVSTDNSLELQCIRPT